MTEKSLTGIVTGSIIVFAYAAAFVTVNSIIFPIQVLALPDIAPYAALIFLPHGVRVIATWIYREKAIIPLLVAHIIMYRLFYWHSDTTAENMVAVLSGSFCAFIALQLFNFSRIDVSLSNIDISHWRTLILLGFVASVFNALGNTLALGATMGNELHLSVLTTFLIGDTLGTAGCLLILMFVFRLRRMLDKTN